MSSNSTNIDPAILTSILGEKRASEKYAKLGIAEFNLQMQQNSD